MIRPTRRLLGLMVAWLVLGGLACLWPVARSAWLGALLAIAVAMLVDGLILRRRRMPTVRRTLPGAFALGESHDVGLHLENPGLAALEIQVEDQAPLGLELVGWPQRVTVAPGGWVDLSATLTPKSRGNFTLPAVHLNSSGPLGLVERCVRLPVADSVRVLPNFKAVARFALLAVDRRRAALGVHLRRRRGSGMEFHQLRDYRDGDSLRQIDWKACSRHDRLISREYREETDQQVILLIDQGRRMRALDGDLSHFDQALDAALLLAYVALAQGDAVGVQTFSGPDRWLPPRKGASTMSTLLQRVYDLQPTLQPSDYAEAARRLATRQRRRSLVVLLTNLRDDDASELSDAFASLRRRHLVLVASLREAAIDRCIATPAQTPKQARTVAASWRYLEARRVAHTLVRGHGLHTLDVVPAQLPQALVSRYLEYKRAGSL
ncbi:MAG: DUF58 domain-containing protein [Oligoflexia bacterium]|nr:DUF58 domain-containing protein [Oligoflexia bacterium]